ncbi:MAG: hypothetical protein ACRETM_07585 [Stenotrophobium sp.]
MRKPRMRPGGAVVPKSGECAPPPLHPAVNGYRSSLQRKLIAWQRALFPRSPELVAARLPLRHRATISTALRRCKIRKLHRETVKLSRRAVTRLRTDTKARYWSVFVSDTAVTADRPALAEKTAFTVLAAISFCHLLNDMMQ